MDVRTETKIFKFGDLYNSTERQEKRKRRDILSRKFSILFIPSHWDKYIVGSNVTQFLKKKKDMFHVTFYFSSAGPLLPFYWRFPCVWYWKILSIIGPLLPWDQDWLVIGVWRLRHAQPVTHYLTFSDSYIIIVLSIIILSFLSPSGGLGIGLVRITYPFPIHLPWIGLDCIYYLLRLRLRLFFNSCSSRLNVN